MKKLTILTFILLFCSSAVFAQRTGAVSGQITDDSSADNLPGAVIEFRSVADTTIVKYELSGVGGKFTVSNLIYGDYTMKVSFLGYESYHNKITVNARNMTISNIFMVPSVTEIDEINVTTQAIRMSMHGDTVVYNAHAFKVSEDDDAEALLKQLPGVEVVNGQVKAQGKDISKIFVDGKETFGTDVTTTMRNIPANMIDKVEVYEKLSDFAETTGIHDGDEYQVMNFVTGITFAHYGDFSALYGYEDMYAANAQYNIVTGNHGIRINAGSNNTGASSFGGGSMMVGMFGGGGHGGRYGGQGGASANNKTLNHNAGLNYNLDQSNKLKLSFYYQYNQRENETKSESETRYFNNPLYDQTFSTSNRNASNYGHNFGSHISWTISPKHKINMRVNGNIDNGTSNSLSESSNFIDNITDLVQYLKNDNRNNTESYSINGQLNYGMKLNEKGRSLSFGINGGINKNDGDNLTNSHLIRDMKQYPKIDSLGRSTSTNNSNGYSMRGRIEYFEPLTQYLRLTASYELSYRYSDNDNDRMKWFYDNDFNDGHYAPWDEGSNIMSSSNYSHLVGPGLHYYKNNNLLRFNIIYKYTSMEGERTLPAPEFKSKADFNNFVYNASFRKQLTPQKNLDFNLGSDTSNPTITQLQNIDDISTNGLFITGGNSALKPYYSHNGSVGYSSYNMARSTSFSVNVNASITKNFIGSDKIIVDQDGTVSPNGTILEAGQQYSRPINIDKSAWQLGVYANFGKPLQFIKSNFNLSGSVNYNEQPSLINGEENTVKTQSYSLNARLDSNFSTDMTIGLSYSITPSWTNNTLEGYSSSTGLGQSINTNFYWRTWKDFVLRANLSYTHTKNKQGNIANDYVYENIMGNFSLGKKLFKNKRGEITFAINDIFNQNNISNQTVNPESIIYNKDKGIGRYFSLSFRYQLRNFQKEGGARTHNVESRERRSGGGNNRAFRRMGAGTGASGSNFRTM